MTDNMASVRNKTGEPRYIATLGEEGFPVYRTLGDDECVRLPSELASRLAEQPGWELDHEDEPREVKSRMSSPGRVNDKLDGE